MKTRLVTLTILSLVALRNPGFAQGPERVTVCDLLGNLEKWHNKLIEVTAEVNFSRFPEQTPTLSGSSCLTKIAIDSVEFPNAIDIVYTDLLPNTGFTTDESSRTRFDGGLDQIDPQIQHVHATFVGMFQTMVPLSNLVGHAPNSKPWRRGLGNQGSYAAHLVVKTISEVSIEKNTKRRDFGPEWLELQREWLSRQIIFSLRQPTLSSSYWRAMRNALVPGGYGGVYTLQGTVIQIVRRVEATHLIVGVTDARKPEVTLRIHKISGNEVNLDSTLHIGTLVEFNGIAREFTVDPFMLTLDVDLSHDGDFRIVRW